MYKDCNEYMKENTNQTSLQHEKAATFLDTLESFSYPSIHTLTSVGRKKLFIISRNVAAFSYSSDIWFVFSFIYSLQSLNTHCMKLLFKRSSFRCFQASFGRWRSIVNVGSGGHFAVYWGGEQTSHGSLGRSSEKRF